MHGGNPNFFIKKSHAMGDGVMYICVIPQNTSQIMLLGSLQHLHGYIYNLIHTNQADKNNDKKQKKSWVCKKVQEDASLCLHWVDTWKLNNY